MTETNTNKVTTQFLCLAHAPAGVKADPYDDGRPACVVCGTANYAVKPYTYEEQQ